MARLIKAGNPEAVLLKRTVFPSEITPSGQGENQRREIFGFSGQGSSTPPDILLAHKDTREWAGFFLPGRVRIGEFVDSNTGFSRLADILSDDDGTFYYMDSRGLFRKPPVDRADSIDFFSSGGAVAFQAGNVSWQGEFDAYRCGSLDSMYWYVGAGESIYYVPKATPSREDTTKTLTPQAGQNVTRLDVYDGNVACIVANGDAYYKAKDSTSLTKVSDSNGEIWTSCIAYQRQADNTEIQFIYIGRYEEKVTGKAGAPGGFINEPRLILRTYTKGVSNPVDVIGKRVGTWNSGTSVVDWANDATYTALSALLSNNGWAVLYSDENTPVTPNPGAVIPDPSVPGSGNGDDDDDNGDETIRVNYSVYAKIVAATVDASRDIYNTAGIFQTSVRGKRTVDLEITGLPLEFFDASGWTITHEGFKYTMESSRAVLTGGRERLLARCLLSKVR